MSANSYQLNELLVFIPQATPPATTMSQSPALEPGNLCSRRKCERKTRAAIASAIKMALVAIIARDAEVIMIENIEMPFKAVKETETSN